MGGLVSYLLDHELLSVVALLALLVLAYLARASFEHWLARRRQQTPPDATDDIGDGSVVQRTSTGDIRTGGGDVDISPRIDNR